MPLSTLHRMFEFLLLCYRASDEVVGVDHSKRDPLSGNGVFSALFFTWASPMIYTGIRRPLVLTDILGLPSRLTSVDACNDLKSLWETEKAEAGAVHREPSFERVVWRSVRSDMFWVFFWKMNWLLFGLISNCYLLRAIVQWLSMGGNVSEGLLYALGFFLAETARSVCVNRHWLLAVLVGVRIRAGSRALLYEKGLRLRGASSSTGKLVQLITGDTGRLLEGCNYSEFLISTPITVLAALGLMLWLIGPSAFAGFAVLALYLPLQAVVASRLSMVRRATAGVADERTSIMGEILSGMRLLKLYSYEASFAEKLGEIRTREIGHLRSAALLRAVNTTAAISVTVLVLLAVFATFSLSDTNSSLRPDVAFTVVALFNIARFPLGVLPQATRCFSEAKVACQRIRDFLLLPEGEPGDFPIELHSSPPASSGFNPDKNDSNEGLGGEDGGFPSTVALAAQNATFVWSGAKKHDKPLHGRDAAATSATSVVVVVTAEQQGVQKDESVVVSIPGSAPPRSEKEALKNLNFALPMGTLTVVVGSVGSGKTSLLEAFLGLLSRKSGGLFVRGNISCAPQVPWIFSGSLRENILFGAPFEEGRYERVLAGCGLLEDIAGLPDGDKSEIGERGVNLSGGQKARVGLARALFADADVYLLDDVLSALDVAVATHVWNTGIGWLRKEGKTVVLVTHALHLLSSTNCDAVMVIKSGEVTKMGPFQSLSPNELTPASTVQIKQEATPVTSVRAPGETATTIDGSITTTTTAAAAAAASSNISILDQVPSPSNPTFPTAPPAAAAQASSFKLLVAEERIVGSVTWTTWALYFGAAGGIAMGAILGILLLLGKGSVLLSSYFLAFWTSAVQSATSKGTPPPTIHTSVLQLYLPLYSGSCAGVVIFNIAQGLLFARVTTVASKVLHDTVFSSVMRGAVSWFDSQPTGRILSRFTGDIDVLDTGLPGSLETCLEFLMQCFLAVVLLAAVFPAFLGPLAALLGVFYYLFTLFRRIARELKRVDNGSRGPLVSLVTATATGLSTISAFRAEARYKALNSRAIDVQSRTYWALYAANRWLAIRVDLLTSAIAAITAALCVAFRESLTPGTAALALATALSLSGTLQFSVRLTTELESSFTCVERLQAYASGGGGGGLVVEEKLCSNKELGGYTEEEVSQLVPVLSAAAGSGALKPVAPSSFLQPQWYPNSWLKPLYSTGWPWAGRVEFRKLSTRYHSSLPLVLDSVSFVTEAGESCGIVGRTGCGKTSLTLALFRVLEAESGGIFIDGVDISRVNIHHLRSRLAIIPQDPTLFIGTLRSNLDMFNEHSGVEGEARLVSCARAAGLGAFFTTTRRRKTENHNHGAVGVGEGSAPCDDDDGDASASGGGGGLETPVAEGGRNLSVGQRQLVCLARALLRGAKVLVLDEATANLDKASDEAVGEALRTSFRHCTKLIVAHRLRTVIACDKVVGLRSGRVIDFDSPSRLLDDTFRGEEGCVGKVPVFSSLVADLGSVEAAELKTMARRASD